MRYKRRELRRSGSIKVGEQLASHIIHDVLEQDKKLTEKRKQLHFQNPHIVEEGGK